MQVISPDTGSRASRPAKKTLDLFLPISRLIVGYRSAKVLLTAVSVDLFEQFKHGPRSPSSASEVMGWDARAGEIFLDALTALGLLKKSSRGYSNTSITNQCLLKDAPLSVFHNLRFQDLIWKDWSNLGYYLKSPHKKKELVARLSSTRFTNEYIHGMQEIARQSAPAVAEKLFDLKPRDMLDVGAGAGSYSTALLDRHPYLKATCLDLPATLKFTRNFNKPFRGRIRYLPGDYHKMEFGKEAFDLVLLSHVTHDEGELQNQSIISKAYKSLRPGGAIALHDFMLADSGTRPLFGALFSIHMLVYTMNGRAYRKSECMGWLGKAGFQKVESHPISIGAQNESVLLIGKK